MLKYGKKARGLPAMLAPMYQELAVGNNVMLTVSLTCATHCSCACGVASMEVRPVLRMVSIQSEIHSTCCSIDTGMFERTDGLCGPVTVKKFGKLAMEIPRKACGPSAHSSSSVQPPRPFRFKAF